MLSVFNHLAIDLIWKDGYLFIYLFVYLFNPFLQNLSVSDAVIKPWAKCSSHFILMKGPSSERQLSVYIIWQFTVYLAFTFINSIHFLRSTQLLSYGLYNTSTKQCEKSLLPLDYVFIPFRKYIFWYHIFIIVDFPNSMYRLIVGKGFHHFVKCF